MGLWTYQICLETKIEWQDKVSFLYSDINIRTILIVPFFKKIKI